MRIAINTRFLLSHKMEGIGWFTYEVCKRMVEQHPEHEFHFFFDRAHDERFIFGDNVVPHILYPSARHPILYKIWFDQRVPTMLRRISADLFFSPDGFLSQKTLVPQVPVIHDLNFEHHPEQLRLRDRVYFRRYFPRFAEKAQHIITVSDYSKQDIMKTYGIEGENISVCHNGANEIFRPLSEDERREARRRFAEGAEYFVFVGALHPRKNVEGLFRAFDRFVDSTDTSTRLLIIGEKLWSHDGVEQAYQQMKHKARVQFSGHLPIKELANAVGGARALVFPSFFEGFGIPLVEAMKAGVPIASSEATCLPEVAGDAAIYFDPHSTEEMSQALHRLDKDTTLRNTLIMHSQERGKLFSWDKTAAGCWEVLESVLSVS